jgi:hypothetical protein
MTENYLQANPLAVVSSLDQIATNFVATQTRRLMDIELLF